jgi:phosphoglucosamine mutase
LARKLFGTDGIRGEAGTFPLDRVTVYRVGAAIGRWITRQKGASKVLIGMDTRESGSWMAAEVGAGLKAQGIETAFAGVTTTPGVAYLTKNGPFSAGVMISASHNPYRDNGIKLIGHSGFKLPDAEEEALERDLESAAIERPGDAPPLIADGELDHQYVEHLAATLPAGLQGLRILMDCANGSASTLGPDLLERLGAKVEPIHCAPDGRNINLNSGSLHIESLRSRVQEGGYDAAVAFDGDADRALFVSGSGKVIDGDAVLLIAARHMQQQGKLGTNSHPVVVATVMSNLGLERALASHGIGMVRTPVGDKYVLEEMLRRGAALGGEQSGHIIFRDYATTGDGLLTALRVFEVMRETGSNLDELTSELEIYPQRLVNVRVRGRKPLDQLPDVAAEIREAECSFGDSGRVLVRFSGTEPLARVMVEGPDLDRVEHFANSIADRIRAELGE